MSSYKTVQSFVLDRIRDKVYEEGKLIATMRDLAHQTGVSLPTVHRAVLELVKEGYLRKEPNRGYAVVNRSGSSSKANSVVQVPPMTVGYMVGSFPPAPGQELSSHFGQAFLPIQNGVMYKGYSTLVLGGVPREHSSSFAFQPPEEIKALGLAALVTSSVFDLGYLKDLSRVQSRLVALDVDASNLGVDSVSFDNRGSACRLVRKLAKKGAQRIAFIGGPYPPPRKPSRLRDSYDPCAAERHQGWRLGLESIDQDPNEHPVGFVKARTREATREAVQRLLNKQPRPDGICAEDPQCVALALAEEGIAPGEILIGGWGTSLPKETDSGTEYLSLLAICSFAELGKKGAELLVGNLEELSANVRNVLAVPPIQDLSKEGSAE